MCLLNAGACRRPTRWRHPSWHDRGGGHAAPGPPLHVIDDGIVEKTMQMRRPGLSVSSRTERHFSVWIYPAQAQRPELRVTFASGLVEKTNTQSEASMLGHELQDGETVQHSPYSYGCADVIAATLSCFSAMFTCTAGTCKRRTWARVRMAER